MKLQPYFKNTFTQYNNLQKDELIALTKCNIEEWKDKSSLELISTMFSINENTFIEIMMQMGFKIKSAYVYSFVDTSIETSVDTDVKTSVETSVETSVVETSKKQSNWICSTCTYSSSNANNECEMCGFPKNDESSMISSSLLNILNEPEIPITNNMDSISDTASVTASVTTSIGTNNSSTIDHSESIKSKIYVKGWDIKDSPFLNNTQDDLVNHFNNAMCRAREGGIIKYIIGIEQLPKPNSVLLTCINSITATAALELNNAVMWKDKYLEVKRPQGYSDDGKISNIILKMKVIPEKKGITPPPIYSSADLKEMERIKMVKKRDKIENDKLKMVNSYAGGGGGGGAGGGGGGFSSSRPPLVPKVKIIPVTLPTLTPEQKTLVDSLKAKLRKNARECLNILCSHDGRETSVHSDALSELCHVLQDHGILTAILKGNKLIIKDNITSSKSFCIDMNNHAQGHVMLHSIADVRNLLRSSNFPEFAFV
jgi:hypothetical protein